MMMHALASFKFSRTLHLPVGAYVTVITERKMAVEVTAKQIQALLFENFR
jgi:hypothetical protein